MHMRICVFWNVNPCNGRMVPYLLKQHIGFNLNHKFNMKKSPLEHEFRAFLQILHNNRSGM